MGELLQLDAAATLVGKSEVTLRRLVKAGKVKAHKEKTLTGFIYRVDADEVRAYYQQREIAFAGALETPEPLTKSVQPEEEKPAIEQPQHQASPGHAIASNGKVRVAIANESGNSAEYWLKRSEMYEDKYHREVQRGSEMREELGIWRGRAEHAQAMLMKMLPTPQPIEILGNATQSNNRRAEKQSTGVGYTVLICIIFVLIAAGFAYFLIIK